MNNILSTGFSRYSSGTLTNNISFNNQSLFIGEYTGDAIKNSDLIRNYNNTIIGFKAAQNSVNLLKNIIIGYEAYMNGNGSNNIVIGKEYDNGIFLNLYDIILLGHQNSIQNYSVCVGSSNTTIGYQNLTYGILNNIYGMQNIALGSDNYYIGNNTITIGNNNKINFQTKKSLIIGNNNGYQDTSNQFLSVSSNISSNINDNIIIIGNNNLNNSLINYSQLLSSNPILIGYNLNTSNNNYIINFGDTLLRYDNFSNNEILFLGNNNKYNKTYGLHTAIGFNEEEIYNIDYQIQQATSNESSNIWRSLYVKNGIYTDCISIGSYSPTYIYNTSNTSRILYDYTSNINFSCSLYTSPLLISNIEYTLPILPNDTTNIVLSSDKNGIMFWKNVNFEDIIKNTDQLKQGTSNLYYNDIFVSSKINAIIRETFGIYFNQYYGQKISTLNLDQIINGTSNRYIQNGIYDQNLNILGSLYVSKLTNIVGNMVKDSITSLNISSNILIPHTHSWSEITNKPTIISSQWTTLGTNIYYNSGSVGIGLDNPNTSYKLHVVGDIYDNGSIMASGSILSSFSDIRLKTIVSDIEEPIKKIMNIKGFRYIANETANISDNKIYIGVSAQDVQSVLPEVVSLAPFDTSNLDTGEIVSKSGSNYLTVSYERLVPVLIECIKDLQNKYESLENKYESLEKRLALIES